MQWFYLYVYVWYSICILIYITNEVHGDATRRALNHQTRIEMSSPAIATV